MQFNGNVFILLFIFSACGCSRDIGLIGIDNLLSFQLQTFNTSGAETNTFSQGSDIEFEIVMTNITNSPVSFYGGLKCAEMKFQVFRNDTLIGHPHLNVLSCPENLKLEYIQAGEQKKTRINWFNNALNQPLLVGNYVVVFSTEIAISEPKNWVQKEFRLNFSVQ